MTERDLYDAALIEINKLEAPSMLLEDYNYFINKAIQQYINKTYNRYELNQQATDDLRALKVSTSIDIQTEAAPVFPNEKAMYYCELPSDYMHMLNCVVSFNRTNNNNKCSESSIPTSYLARKLTADVYPSIINNAYFKPSYRTPYYSIFKKSKNEDVLDSIINPCKIESPTNLTDSIIDPCGYSESYEGYILHIRCGDTNKYQPAVAYVEYLKIPNIVHLTEEDLESVEDYTKVLEFPEYVCYEIINEFVKLLLENTADPRLSTNVPINQTIIPPVSE